jgi:hypothetical protein
LTEDKPADDAEGKRRTIEQMESSRWGRNRNRQAWKIASRGAGVSRAFRFQRKNDRHDRIALDNADEKNSTNQGDDAKLRLEKPAASGQASWPKAARREE